MSKKLPRVQYPLFDVPFPSQGSNVKARGFQVREEKILLTALESGEDSEIVSAIQQIIGLCVVDREFDTSKLTMYDLELMFIKLRSRSVNNIIEVTYKDMEDDKEYPFTIDLDEVILQNPTSIDNKIQLSDDIGIIMTPPSVEMIKNAPTDLTAEKLVEYLITSCLVAVYDVDDVYYITDTDPQETTEFLDSLSSADFEKINSWFESLPKLYYKIEYVNALGNKREIVLDSLNDFFTWR